MILIHPIMLLITGQMIMALTSDSNARPFFHPLPKKRASAKILPDNPVTRSFNIYKTSGIEGTPSILCFSCELLLGPSRQEGSQKSAIINNDEANCKQYYYILSISIYTPMKNLFHVQFVFSALLATFCDGRYSFQQKHGSYLGKKENHFSHKLPGKSFMSVSTSYHHPPPPPPPGTVAGHSLK